MGRPAKKSETETDATKLEETAEPVQDVLPDDPLLAVDQLITGIADAQASDPRPKLAFVQFATPARIGGRSATPLVAWGKGARFYVEEVPGIGKCVVAEGKPFPKRGYVPWENVAAFGIMP